MRRGGPGQACVHSHVQRRVGQDFLHLAATVAGVASQDCVRVTRAAARRPRPLALRSRCGQACVRVARAYGKFLCLAAAAAGVAGQASRAAARRPRPPEPHSRRSRGHHGFGRMQGSVGYFGKAARTAAQKRMGFDRGGRDGLRWTARWTERNFGIMERNLRY